MGTNTVPQGLFGPGILWVTRTDIANATPTNIGYINEFSTDATFTTENLYGQKQFALLSARGTAKASGKMKPATLSGQALNTVLLGGTWTAGTQYDATTTAPTAIPTTPYQITPTVPSSGTWNSDLGVTNSATAEPLTYIGTSGTPAAGQYTCNAGQYTFSAADHTAGISVNISFSYTYTSAPGQSQVIQNQDIGTTPTFQLDYKTTLYGATYYIRLFQCIGGKWSQQHKLTGFSMPEYDFDFFANAAQQVGIISLATQA